MKGPISCALYAALLGCVGILTFDTSPAGGTSLNLVPQDPDLGH